MILGPSVSSRKAHAQHSNQARSASHLEKQIYRCTLLVALSYMLLLLKN